jgi:hypothetical protein
MRTDERFNVVGEDENLPIDYTKSISNDLQAAGIRMSEWDTELDPSAPRDKGKTQAHLSVKYLQVQDFTGVDSVFDLIRELRTVGRPASIKEIIGAMATSEVLKRLLKLDEEEVTRFRMGDPSAVVISSIPAMDTLQEDGTEIPTICRYGHSDEWGLIPHVAWMMAHPVPGRQCLFIVVTNRT